MKLLSQFLVFITAIALSTGCTSFIGSNENETPEPVEVDRPETVGDATRPHGLGVASVESVGLVTGVSNTGSDPPPSQQRQMLLEEMKRREVDNPNQLLANESTALVLVRAKLPPGVRKGDRINVEVRVPNRSKTTSLAGGWLMETKLREVAVLDQSLRSGHVRGVVEGPILIQSLTGEASDKVASLRGIVLGGGVATKSRPIGLKLRGEHHSVSMSKIIGDAINRRFDTYVRGKRQGAATPQTDKFIALEIHPRYRHNLIRFLRVIEQIPLRESQMGQIDRLKTLENDLLVPALSSLAAVRLEAIGSEATSTLLAGLQSGSAEVRFYAAEALAYLDHADAAGVLAASTNESAFRSRALSALGAMSSIEAHDAISNLLHVPSAETRYGAFRALQQMNPRDPLLGQDAVGQRIAFHEIASQQEPMIHVSRTERPEVVVFGNEQRIATPLMILVGKSIIVKDDGRQRIRVTRYLPGKKDQSRTCPATANELVRTLIELDTTYPDIVTVLQEAKSQGALDARLVFDAIAKAGRTYSRSE